MCKLFILPLIGISLCNFSYAAERVNQNTMSVGVMVESRTTVSYDHAQYRDAPIRRVTHENSVSGSARVKDGDTLEINGVSVRLYGIDAPEKAQTCRHRFRETMCGLEAIEFMVALTNGRQVTCSPVPGQRDQYGRMIGKCYTADNEDLGSAMVSAGQALAYRRYSVDYVNVEDQAHANKRGIWSSTFVFPWDWRKGVR